MTPTVLSESESLTTLAQGHHQLLAHDLEGAVVREIELIEALKMMTDGQTKESICEKRERGKRMPDEYNLK
jgi:hypothetical protein